MTMAATHWSMRRGTGATPCGRRRPARRGDHSPRCRPAPGWARPVLTRRRGGRYSASTCPRGGRLAPRPGRRRPDTGDVPDLRPPRPGVSGRRRGRRALRPTPGLSRAEFLSHVAGDQLTLTSLAETLADTGTVRGMELDIHPQMVNVFVYHRYPGLHGTGRKPAGARDERTARPLPRARSMRFHRTTFNGMVNQSWNGFTARLIALGCARARLFEYEQPGPRSGQWCAGAVGFAVLVGLAGAAGFLGCDLPLSWYRLPFFVQVKPYLV